MTRYEIIMKDENGIYESYIYSTKSKRDVLKIVGVAAVTSEKRVKHPSPEVLQTVLTDLGISYDVFYGRCEMEEE